MVTALTGMLQIWVVSEHTIRPLSFDVSSYSRPGSNLLLRLKSLAASCVSITLPASS